MSAKRRMKSGAVSKTTTTNGPPQITLSEEKQKELDNELNWCIYQLEFGIKSKEADEYQKQESKKALTTLKSKKTPNAQKRQLMRVIFGDYRTLMKTYPIPTTTDSTITMEKSEEENKEEKKDEENNNESTTKE
ncbi:hypothetical protein ABK040_004663 [Willaertia magna]